MRSSKIYYVLFFAVFMLMAKPFVGFSALKQLQHATSPQILVKAFTKRKQEYVENSAFDSLTIHKRLADPLLALTILFSGFLNTLFPSIFCKAKQVTTGILSDIHCSLFPPLHRYLLSGTLLI